VAARDKFGRRRTFALVRNIFDDVEGVYQQSACCEIGGMRQEEDYSTDYGTIHTYGGRGRSRPFSG
jgi:hypothetical protein